MPEAMQNVITTIHDFLIGSDGQGGVFSWFRQFFSFVSNDSSGTMLTFVIAFPLCFLGVWIIKKLVRVKDT